MGGYGDQREAEDEAGGRGHTRYDDFKTKVKYRICQNGGLAIQLSSVSSSFEDSGSAGSTLRLNVRKNQCHSTIKNRSAASAQKRT